MSIEEYRRLIRYFIKMPAHIQTALAIFLEWQAEQNDAALAAPPNQH